MAVLVHLAHYAGEVRTRDEMLEAVWGDAFVTEEVLSHCIWDLRRALGDDARKPRFIQTIPKRGYRLIVPVSWLEAGHGDTPRYRLLQQLGSGTMGVVWKAEDTLLHRAVALKFLPPEWSRDPAAKERFLREARLAAALDHPNICTLYEVGETDDGRLFLVLGFHQGETLAARLERGPLPWREAVAVAIDTARGLQAAHDAGIVHRDVKPANLMLARSNEASSDRVYPDQVRPDQVRPDRVPADRLKILDFGIARFADETQFSQTGSSSPGTPAYRSPEQTRGDRVDPRTDIWSLGVVLTEMLTGRKPFRGDYEQAVVHAILNDEPEPLSTLAPQVPSALEAVVGRMLSRDADRRYPDMEALIADLVTVVRGDGEAGKAPESAPAAVSQEPVLQPQGLEPAADDEEPSAGWQRRWPAVLVAVALLAIATATADLWWPTEAEPLRIAVLRPEVLQPNNQAAEDSPELAIAASGLLVTTLSGLAAFENLVPLDPSQIADETLSAVDVARAAAADEVLASTLEWRGPLVWVTLRRIRGEDGRVLWTDAFEARSDPNAARLLADRVRSRLREAYSGYSQRTGTPDFDVLDQDYRTFLEIQQRSDAGEPATGTDIETLEHMTTTSPRFLEAYLTAVDRTAVVLQDERRVDDLERGLRLIGKAEGLAPGDPRPIASRLRLELAAGRLEEAAVTLDRLEVLIPGDVLPLQFEAQLLQKRGDLDKAMVVLRAAVALRPSWTSLSRLADLEYRSGREDDARSHLEQLLEIAPGNRWGLSKLAELELFYGDLEVSESLYQSLAARHERRNYWTNLGVAQFLLGHYEPAVASYLEALALAPGHPVVLVNLAEAEFALGQLESARERCRDLLRRLEINELKAPLGAIDSMTRALCQARRSQQQLAVATTLRALQAHPQDAEVAYQAAMVYALTGDRNSALVNAERAWSLGVRPRWFRVPGFDSLRDDPTFATLQNPASDRPTDPM